MTLTHILVFTILSALAGWLLPPRWRLWGLMSGSLIAVFWLQPSTPIRNLDFWLPSASIFLTIFVWAVTRAGPDKQHTNTTPAIAIVIGVLILIGLTRYIQPLCCLIPTRPPNLLYILASLAGAALVLAATHFAAARWKLLPAFSIAVLLLLFTTLKSEQLALGASAWLRSLTGQTAALASTLDLPWLGFSYLAFRLIHMLRDHQTGKLPAYELDEFITYALFFATFTAGPIDRSQRFIGDLHRIQDATLQEHGRIRFPSGALRGGQRIFVGIFKKFALADSLALIALGPQNAGQVYSSLWIWVMLYAYALRIYFDFSGYSDIAIGLGNLTGIDLPENFERPYLKLNLTTFWNSWHITLAQWFRAYLFNPLTRFLRKHPQKPPAWFVILAGQLSTMLLIGLWHGLTWNFAIWGLWHGFGLFVHNRWGAWARPRFLMLQSRPRMLAVSQFLGWFLTFHFVLLGWIWFALPNPALAWQVFIKLFGF